LLDRGELQGVYITKLTTPNTTMPTNIINNNEKRSSIVADQQHLHVGV